MWKWLLVLVACGGGSVEPDGGTAGDGGSADAGDPGDAAGFDDRFEVIKPALRDPERWSEARCNDGTPFYFKLRLAAQPSSVWVIHLQGGGFCDDNALACDDRDPALTTGTPVADGALVDDRLAGILSRSATTNPTFSAANHVHAHYCSSDFWAGATTERRPSSADTEGWYYSGRANVAAMLEILAEGHGLDDADPETEVLFSGSSAGALGAHFNAAAVEAALPATAAAGRLRVFIDAGWMFDWDDPAYRLGAATTSDREAWRVARDFWAATFDPACEAAASDPMDCFFGPGWYAQLGARLPVLVQQSSIDATIMGVHGLSASEPAADTWQAGAEASLAGVTRLFSGDLPYHTLALCDETSGCAIAGIALGPTGSTLRDVLARFWADQPAERVEF